MPGRARSATAAFSVLVALLSLGCTGRPAPRSTPPAPTAKPGATTPPQGKAAGNKPECIVLGATTEPQGQAAERAWLREHYPGGREKEQSLGQGLPPESRVYDYVVMVDAAGIEYHICFDITAWFGKF